MLGAGAAFGKAVFECKHSKVFQIELFFAGQIEELSDQARGVYLILRPNIDSLQRPGEDKSNRGNTNHLFQVFLQLALCGTYKLL